MSVCVTSPGWTNSETDIVHGLIEGALVNLSNRTEDARNIRATVLRDLLLERWPNDVTFGSASDSRGLRLRGANVIGRLDLDYLQTGIGLALLECTIGDGITAKQGRLARLDLTGSIVGPPSERTGPQRRGSYCRRLAFPCRGARPESQQGQHNPPVELCDVGNGRGRP